MKTFKKIHVHCAQRYGISNRIRSLAGHYALARVTGSAFSFSWDPDLSCPGNFSEIFSSSLVCQADIPAIDHDAEILSIHPGSIPSHCGSTTAAIAASYIPEEVAGIFQVEVSNFYANLSPKPVIVERSALILKKLAQSKGFPCLGLHLRRTDLISHLSARGEDIPTDDAVFAKVDAYLHVNPGAMIFCSTDNPASECAVLRRYSERVVYNQKNWIDDNSEGALNHKVQSRLSTLEESAVDLYCLSRCDFIIGTKGSSFGSLSASWGSKPIVLI
jgi:hypothetical protein